MGQKFNWDDFETYKVAVICDAEEKYNAFMKECGKRNLMWGRDMKAIDGADYRIMRASYADCGVAIACGKVGGILTWSYPQWYIGAGLSVCTYDEIQSQIKSEPHDDGSVSWKLIIEGCGDTTTAKYIEGKKVVASGSVKRCSKDKHSPKSATLAVVEKVFSEDKKEPEKSGFTGKAVCKSGGGGFVEGKIYTFENGYTVDDDGAKRPFVESCYTDCWIDGLFIRIVE